MKLYLETERPGPSLYVNIPDAQPLFLKSIDPVKWARKFDSTNGGQGHKKDSKNGVASSKKEDDQLYLHVNKSLDADEWINQFIGTTLFDEAHGLCQDMISLREERANAGDKPVTDNWKKQDKIEVQKRKLILKLAQLRDTKVKKLISKLEGTNKSSGSRPGQHDLSDFMADLMDTMPGESLKKKGSKNGR